MLLIDELLKLNLHYNEHVKFNVTTTTSKSSSKSTHANHLPIPMFVKSNPQSERLYFQRLAEKVLLVQKEEHEQQSNAKNHNKRMIAMAKLDRYCLNGRQPCLFKK